jgi:peroxiredoxin
MSVKYTISRSHLFILLIFSLITIGLNIFLLKQNFDLKKAYLTTDAIPSEIQLLPLNVKNSDNDVFQLLAETDTNSKTILFVFSSMCKFCHKNIDSWKKILEVKQKENLSHTKVVGISFDQDTTEFVKQHDLENQFLVVNLLENKIENENIFSSTPQTLILNSEGKIEKAWNGLLTKDEVLEIISLLKASVN